MKELSDELLRVVQTAEPKLRAVSDAESAKPALRGGWSRKQVIAHLIDSASNNHQRFVRAVLQGSLEFPAYDTDGNVIVAGAQQMDWSLLITLWAAYNRYLAQVIARLPEEKLGVLCHIGDHEPMTLEFLATAYLRHLLHHLGQIGAD